ARPYILSLHDALPISRHARGGGAGPDRRGAAPAGDSGRGGERRRGARGMTGMKGMVLVALLVVQPPVASRDSWFGVDKVKHFLRSEEHTSELQSRENL